MQNSFNIDALLDALATKVAEKIRAELAQAGNGAGVRPRLLTLEQAGTYIGRSPQAVQHMVNSGKLPKVQGDRRIFLDVRDLDRWIEANKRPVDI